MDKWVKGGRRTGRGGGGSGNGGGCKGGGGQLGGGATFSHGTGGLSDKETGRDIHFSFPFYSLAYLHLSPHPITVHYNQPSGGIPTPIHP